MKIFASRGEGLVGIWWYMPTNMIIGYSCSLENGYNDGNYIQYDNVKNHLNLWKQVVKDNTNNDNDFNDIYSKGYKSLERGRVIFNLRTQCYEILCSEKLFQNLEFRQNVINQFNLTGNRYEFIKCNHYYVCELTGNPELDNLYYESQF